MIEMKCCDILGTRILVTNMADTVERIEHDMEELRGKYICVGNVHTTVMAHDDAHYHEVQKSAAFVLPDESRFPCIAENTVSRRRSA